MTFGLPHWNNFLPARELARLLIHFHQPNYRNFYIEYFMTHLRNGLVSSC
jgi:hypothetical protein